MNLRAVRALTIVATINGTPHDLSSLSLEYRNGWQIQMVDNGQTYIAAGSVVVFDASGAKLVVDYVKPDRIFGGGFQ